MLNRPKTIEITGFEAMTDDQVIRIGAAIVESVLKIYPQAGKPNLRYSGVRIGEQILTDVQRSFLEKDMYEADCDAFRDDPSGIIESFVEGERYTHPMDLPDEELIEWFKDVEYDGNEPTQENLLRAIQDWVTSLQIKEAAQAE